MLKRQRRRIQITTWPPLPSRPVVKYIARGLCRDLFSHVCRHVFIHVCTCSAENQCAWFKKDIKCWDKWTINRHGKEGNKECCCWGLPKKDMKLQGHGGQEGIARRQFFRHESCHVTLSWVTAEILSAFCGTCAETRACILRFSCAWISNDALGQDGNKSFHAMCFLIKGTL